jgi:hypothetical protein
MSAILGSGKHCVLGVGRLCRGDLGSLNQARTTRSALWQPKARAPTAISTISTTNNSDNLTVRRSDESLSGPLDYM